MEKIFYRKKRRGQVFFIDAIVVSMAVMLILILLLFSLSLVENLRKKSDKMSETAENAANILLLTNGDPPDWWASVQNINSLGIGKRRNIIDSEKLNLLNTTNYRDLLSLRTYQFRINITINSTSIYQMGNISNASELVVIERLCIINDSYCKMKIEIGE